MQIDNQEILKMEKYYRANFINSLSGFKSASLIGTKDNQGNTNLALFSSVIHVGANPPLLGFLLRPNSVPRHTYNNIKETEFYTINHINYDIYKSAHITSANFDEGISEFSKASLTEEYLDEFDAPFVKESKIKLGLKFIEEVELKANKTIFIVGEVKKVYLPENIIEDDGSIKIESAKSCAISGLYSYHKTELLDKLEYARPF